MTDNLLNGKTSAVGIALAILALSGILGMALLYGAPWTTRQEVTANNVLFQREMTEMAQAQADAAHHQDSIAEKLQELDVRVGVNEQEERDSKERLQRLENYLGPTEKGR